MLNSRLLACAKFIQGNFVCDVGTDHAQLPVYLIQNQIAEKIIASDVREGPLQSAEKTITKAGLSEKIQTILSDGLQNVPPDGITDIVIAGMGGETMIHILEMCLFPLDTINLILQPMTKAELLRKWLYEHGFEIQKEICVPDKHFLYAVMQVKQTWNFTVPDAVNIYFGKMDLHTKEGLSYAKNEFLRLSRRRTGIYYHEGISVPKELNDTIAAMQKIIKECEKN